MAVWGKLIGGAAGLALGGPMGALLGALAGHGFDRAAPPEPGAGVRDVAFTIGVIALGAKMAKADGAVTRDEVAAFKEVFSVPAEEEPRVARLFDLARRTVDGYEAYARQVARLFGPEDRVVLEDLLGALFHIAKADGAVRRAEMDYLRRVAEIFAIEPSCFERIRRAHVAPELARDDPYATLDVPRDAPIAEIRAAWRRLAAENHPDRAIAAGLPEEAIAVATETMAALNAAWETIKAERGVGSAADDAAA